MGIPTCRFLDRNHEQFTCAICLDVAIDPVLVNSETDCDHIFCKDCIKSDVARCPSCNGEFKDPKWCDIKGALKRVYSDLRMKCLNSSCDKVLIPSDYKYHDENCPITFEICKDCGFKTRRGPNNDHSCVQVLKAEMVSRSKKFEEMEKRMEKVEKMMKDKHEWMEIMVKETEKKIRGKIEEQLLEGNKKIEKLQQRIQFERERMEHLIHLSIVFREKLCRYSDFPWDLRLFVPGGVALNENLRSKQTFRQYIDLLDKELKAKNES